MYKLYAHFATSHHNYQISCFEHPCSVNQHGRRPQRLILSSLFFPLHSGGHGKFKKKALKHDSVANEGGRIVGFSRQRTVRGNRLHQFLPIFYYICIASDVIRS